LHGDALSPSTALGASPFSESPRLHGSARRCRAAGGTGQQAGAFAGGGSADGGSGWPPAPRGAYGARMDLVEVLPRRLYLLASPVGHAYLWCGPDGLTLVDTGMPGSAPRIAAAVEALGFRRQDVRQ